MNRRKSGIALTMIARKKKRIWNVQMVVDSRVYEAEDTSFFRAQRKALEKANECRSNPEVQKIVCAKANAEVIISNDKLQGNGTVN